MWLNVKHLPSMHKAVSPTLVPWIHKWVLNDFHAFAHQSSHFMLLLKYIPISPLTVQILCSLSGSPFASHLCIFPKVFLVLGFFSI